MFFAALAFISLEAQQLQRHSLDWGATGSDQVRNRENTPEVTFKGARFDPGRDQLPYFAENVQLKGNVEDFEVLISDQNFIPLSQAEIVSLKGLGELGPTVKIEKDLGWYHKKPVAQVRIYPYRRNPSTGQIEKLVAFNYEIDPTLGRANSSGRQQRSFASHSKLQTGDWYRFTVATDGVYEIDQAFLSSLGVDVNDLSSNDINIYGNHYGQLSYQNSTPYESDLYLNNILVEDGGDGRFDTGDRILFYGSGPHRWDRGGNGFVHTKHAFTDSSTYFIGIGVEPAARVADIALSTTGPTQVIETFDDRQFFERDNVNLIKSGREFYGDNFDAITEYNYQFNIPHAGPTDSVYLEVDVFSRTIGSSNASSFDVSAGPLNTSFSVSGVTGSFIGAFGVPAHRSFGFVGAPDFLQVNLTFNKQNPVTSLAWTNYLRINARRGLRFVGDQLSFRDLKSVGAGNVGEFKLLDASSVYRIWEITDPTAAGNIPFIDNGGEKTFILRTDDLREFIAFRDRGYLQPVAIGPVENQDIHATPSPIDLVMVVHPDFWSEAVRLKDAREAQGLTVLMVTPQQVYNEYSSGMKDATAIKKLMKMFYDRAGTDPALFPRYLLLFGDGSFNNRSTIASNQSFIPTYQTANSFNLSGSYCSEDYFGLLDDSEGEFTGDLVDIGIGRLPANTVIQARDMVDKILRYDALKLVNASPDETGEVGVKDWRNRVLFISDDQEGSDFEGTIHMAQSETLASRVEAEHPSYIVDRILMDAYQQISTPGGERYPEATEELKNQVQKGLLLVNYIGHGGEVGWGHERFLDVSTILNWTNQDYMPLFMTATCEFTRWDDPARTSAGEFVLQNPNGGGIALTTTTRLAYSSSNFALSNFFYDNVFRKEDDLGRPFTLGDVFRETKAAIADANPNNLNHRNFCLLGDPSLQLAQPLHQVITTSVTDTAGVARDTLQALSVVRVEGIVADVNGVQLNDFNGVVVPTVFDKRKNISTLANDGGNPFNFSTWKNVIYRGQASVTNGAFSFEFVVPKDIAFQYGPGRIAYYAESGQTNAHGFDSDLTVGGTDPNAVADDDGPTINLYMNDENFVPGGLTSEEPTLVAELFDVNGINTLGNSIGHDLKATLDGNTDASIILNDFYEADLDTYQSGVVRYRLEDLEAGTHTIELKAWDVQNNSSRAFTEFIVAETAELALAHVLNYPNPFTTRTDFFFEHNKPGSFLDVQVQIFSVSGRLVKTLAERVNASGFRSDPITWDGRDDFGDKLARGVYVYRLNVITPEGEKAEQLEKLVILN